MFGVSAVCTVTVTCAQTRLWSSLYFFTFGLISAWSVGLSLASASWEIVPSHGSLLQPSRTPRCVLGLGLPLSAALVFLAAPHGCHRHRVFASCVSCSFAWVCRMPVVKNVPSLEGKPGWKAYGRKERREQCWCIGSWERPAVPGCPLPLCRELARLLLMPSTHRGAAVVWTSERSSDKVSAGAVGACVVRSALPAQGRRRLSRRKGEPVTQDSSGGMKRLQDRRKEPHGLRRVLG